MVREQQLNVTPCADKEQDLVLYYYGEISDVERAEVEVHTQSCAGCRRYLGQIGTLLPGTVERDDPEQAFWNDYSREMRCKLAEAECRPWWRPVTEFLHSWAIPAMAVAAVGIIALTFTLGRDVFRSKDTSSSKNISPEEASLMEALPVAENLDFFSNMEILDAMDLLESMSGQGNDQA
jgi:predicted anti-sigma-YlaC factor YlaD